MDTDPLDRPGSSPALAPDLIRGQALTLLERAQRLHDATLRRHGERTSDIL